MILLPCYLLCVIVWLLLIVCIIRTMQYWKPYSVTQYSHSFLDTFLPSRSYDILFYHHCCYTISVIEYIYFRCSLNVFFFFSHYFLSLFPEIIIFTLFLHSISSFLHFISFFLFFVSSLHFFSSFLHFISFLHFFTSFLFFITSYILNRAALKA